MYINGLGMRDEVRSYNTENTKTSNTKASNTKTVGAANTTNFPTAIKQAVESQTATLSEDPDVVKSIEEALERLGNDPEWKDVGTALSALYKNQQKMQVQMNLLSAGYSSALTGLSSYSQYGLGGMASSAYGGISNLLGTSIFGNQLI